MCVDIKAALKRSVGLKSELHTVIVDSLPPPCLPLASPLVKVKLSGSSRTPTGDHRVEKKSPEEKKSCTAWGGGVGEG